MDPDPERKKFTEKDKEMKKLPTCFEDFRFQSSIDAPEEI
jgi:hypothetical protein